MRHYMRQYMRHRTPIPLGMRLALAAFVLSLLGGCAAYTGAVHTGAVHTGAVHAGAAQAGMQAPERATGYTEKPGWTARKFMAATANPLATDTGYQMLRAGGSAVDAAIAAQMVLNLVEPQSSGIGGGAFMLHFDGKTVQAFDGRETAPAAASETLFQDASGKPMPFYARVIGGRSVGVPGVLRMLELAHRRHGKLPWQALFAPAIKLAEEGFAVSPRLAALVRADPYLKNDPAAAAYFYDRNGQPWPAGHMLKNPELARVLREISAHGTQAFYTGRIAREIVAKVRAHPRNPGALSMEDMAAYRAKERAPVCIDYLAWNVCGMPPPSSGGIAVAQMLGILETRNLSALAPRHGRLDPQAVHLFAEAGRLAFADRDRYVADTDFVPLPGNGAQALLDKRYLARRAEMIHAQSMGIAPPGMPVPHMAAAGDDDSPEFPSTSHLSIVDGMGNAVAMTTTIEDAFGSRQMVRGFLLNNELTDFSADAADRNGPIANRVQPGKRPRSSMAPTLVFEKGSNKLVMALGSPGGPAIINYVAKTLVAALDWGMSMQQAIDLPNFGSRNGPTELERGRVPETLIEQLKDKGHAIRLIDQTSGVQGIMRISGDGGPVWSGGADPRREGNAMGD